MLEVRDLTKRYTGIPVVDHVSFAIQRGETLGYLGPNGAGKSTTVKMIIGLLEPTAGEITLDGHNIHKASDARKAFQRRIGYVPEEPHLYPHLGGREYLQLVGRLRGRVSYSNRKWTSFFGSSASGKTVIPCWQATPKACVRRF